MQNFSDLIDDIYYTNEKGHGDELGISSGYKAIDQYTNGFHNGQLTVLASRKGMGKTTLAINIANNIAKQENKKVLFFSLDLPNWKVTEMILKSELESSSPILEEGKRKLLNDRNIYFDEDARYSVLEMMHTAALLKHSKGLDFIVVDYLQLISNYDFSKQGKLKKKKSFEYVVHVLKLMATALNIPVLLLSDLKNSVERRGGDMKPMLYDLDDYGNLEFHADVVLYLYRPSFYEITVDEEGNNVENQSELLILKNKNGECATVKLRQDFKKAKFWDWE